MLWFVVNTLARPINHLAITTLELTTLGYIFCALGILYFWKAKPMDILSPIVLDCPATLEEVLGDRARSELKLYHLTPLECFSREEWIPSLLWKSYVNILRHMRVVHTRPQIKPIQRFTTFDFPKISRSMFLLMLLLGISYTSIFVAAWNFYFPSGTERLLWRIAALGTLILFIVASGYETLFMVQASRSRQASLFSKTHQDSLQDIEQALSKEAKPEPVYHPPPSGSHPRDVDSAVLSLAEEPKRANISLRSGSNLNYPRETREIGRTSSNETESGQSSGTKLGFVRRLLSKTLNNSLDQDPALAIPLHSFVFLTPFGATYCIFRLFILAEDLVSLRRLPDSAFITIDWSAYIPHIQI